MRLHPVQPPANIEQAVLMKKNLVAFISVIIVITLSYNILKAVGLSEYGGLFSINLPFGLAMGMLIFSLPIGLFVIIKTIYIAARWFVRTWKNGGQVK